MTVKFHPAVQQDFNEAIAHYEAEGGDPLADRFEAEFRFCLTAIKTEPTSASISPLARMRDGHNRGQQADEGAARYQPSPIFRRIRLQSFPYLIVYRETTGGVRVTLLRHERRHPLYGITRW